VKNLLKASLIVRLVYLAVIYVGVLCLVLIQKNLILTLIKAYVKNGGRIKMKFTKAENTRAFAKALIIILAAFVFAFLVC